MSARGTFLLGNTEFGLDAAKSYCRARTVDDATWLSFVAVGDKETYQTIKKQEDGPWAWTLYPPRLYGDFPATRLADGTLQCRIGVGDLDEYEVALYLMEHNDVDEMIVELRDGVGEAKGFAQLDSERVPFHVRWPVG